MQDCDSHIALKYFIGSYGGLNCARDYRSENTSILLVNGEIDLVEAL